MIKQWYCRSGRIVSTMISGGRLRLVRIVPEKRTMKLTVRAGMNPNACGVNHPSPARSVLILRTPRRWPTGSRVVCPSRAWKAWYVSRW